MDVLPYRETVPPGIAEFATVNQGWPIRSATAPGPDQSLGVGNLPSVPAGMASSYASTKYEVLVHARKYGMNSSL